MTKVHAPLRVVVGTLPCLIVFACAAPSAAPVATPPVAAGELPPASAERPVNAGVPGRAAVPSAETSDTKKVWLGPPSVVGSSVWFSDELAPIADAVAAALAEPANGGYRVLPPSEARAFWADVQRGRLPGASDVCAAPPPPALLARVVHADSAYGDIKVECDAGRCRLDVGLEPPRAGAPSSERPHFRADLPPKETPSQWAERIRRGALRPAEQVTAPRGVRGALVPPPAKRGASVALSSIEQSGGWAQALTSDLFEPVAADLRTCEEASHFNESWRDWWLQSYVVAVDEEGRATRCEYDHPDRLPTPDFACTCGVLRRLPFGKGAADRRASFSFVPHAKNGGGANVVRSALLVAKKADDPSAVLGSGVLSHVDLARCLEPIAAPLEEKVPLRFRVGRDGRAFESKAEWPPSLPASATRCMDALLKKAHFDCPLSGGAAITATLEVSVRAVGRRP